jgi:hypothetical protein
MNDATKSLAGWASSASGGPNWAIWPALLHDRDAVAEQHRLVDVVGDEHDGLAEIALEPLELLLERAAADRVDGAERLVHQQHGRVGRQRPRHADALLLAAGELARVAVGHPLLEAHELDQLERALALALLVPAEQLGDGGDVVGHAPVREQARPAGSRSRCRGAARGSASSRGPGRRARSCRCSARSGG